MFVSYCGAKFVLIVGIDYSRNNWVFVFRYKLDIVVNIRELRASIKKETNKILKHMRTDSSMEFCSELLNEFYMKEVIVRHHINASETQHVTELISRTLIETTHKVLSSVDITRRFITDAPSMTSYLTNRSRSNVIGCRTLEEV